MHLQSTRKLFNCDGGRSRKEVCGTFQGRYNNKRETGILVHDEAMPAGQRPHLGKVADPLGCRLTGKSPCFTCYIPWRHAGQGARHYCHPGKGRSGGACRPAHRRASWWANVAKFPAAARSPARMRHIVLVPSAAVDLTMTTTIKQAPVVAEGVNEPDNNKLPIGGAL
jgi:hypothetical protein